MSRSFKPIPAGDSVVTGGSASGFDATPAVPKIPASEGEVNKTLFPPLVLYPSLPSASKEDVGAFSQPWQSLVANLPTESDQPSAKPAGRKIEKPVFPVTTVEPTSVTESAIEKPSEQSATFISGESPFKAAPPREKDYDDKDLKEALAPLMRDVVREAVYAGERSNVDALLEPMLRATVRRALAEYSPSNRPFEAPGFVDRTIWRMQALFSSRTFEDVLFEKTHRFQVDEVFLFDAKTLALVSFASCDPARHSKAARVESSAHHIAVRLRDTDGALRKSFERNDGKNVISTAGEHVLLAAVVRGQANEFIVADLGFCLHRIEDHFKERFEEAGSALMHALQPFLEDCLLIQAPASAA